jgi:hypothetical protein
MRPFVLKDAAAKQWAFLANNLWVTRVVRVRVRLSNASVALPITHMLRVRVRVRVSKASVALPITHMLSRVCFVSLICDYVSINSRLTFQSIVKRAATEVLLETMAKGE